MAFRNERLPPSSTHTDSIYYFLLASDILIASLKIYNFFSEPGWPITLGYEVKIKNLWGFVLPWMSHMVLGELLHFCNTE